jgi:hypothetical protein
MDLNFDRRLAFGIPRHNGVRRLQHREPGARDIGFRFETPVCERTVSGWTMTGFEHVNGEQFLSAIAGAPSSRTFGKVFAKVDPQNWLGAGSSDGDCQVHRGTLVLLKNFAAPAVNTLVIGDLIVNGLVDLHCPGVESGGLFVVFGNVTCNILASDFNKAAIIDGDLSARDLIVNNFDDSGLWVTRNLKTKFFYGLDIWAEVGGTAEMHYGDGFCLPIGWNDEGLRTNAARHAIKPRHDVGTSMRLLNFMPSEGKDHIEPWQFLERIEAGRSIFR